MREEIELINQLEQNHSLSKEEYLELLNHRDEEVMAYLRQKAVGVRTSVYQTDVYIRGLIEVTNWCKNDCYYCGIRKSNSHVSRYRLRKEEILNCCELGYPLGFRTFVMQGGEDGYYNDERLVDIISTIKKKYPDCAVTLSFGERSKESYQKLYNAGADRYLLRHETANELHYKSLHPSSLSLQNRKQCLYHLKEIGYQVGCGIMVGSPCQTMEHIAQDLIFIKELNPQMVGIGPFIPQKDTPFANKTAGTLELTLFLLSLLRLMLPKVLLPATTALGTIHPFGREQGILAGANVVMPNLSPVCVRKKYALYDHKICTNQEAAEGILQLKESMKDIGYEIVVNRGDYLI